MNPILRYAAIYGVLAGVIMVSVITLGIVFSNHLHGGDSLWFGYAVQVLVMSLVFVGVKRYRDVERGGVIRFLPALGVGFAISIVAGIMYVVTWESFLAISGWDFMGDYIAGQLKTLHEQGKSAAEIAAKAKEFESFRVIYANPLVRYPALLGEIMIPVGVTIPILSAALLRNPRFLPARAPVSAGSVPSA